MQIHSLKSTPQSKHSIKDENWVLAVNEEISALEINQTWEIVNRQLHKNAYECLRKEPNMRNC